MKARSLFGLCVILFAASSSAAFAAPVRKVHPLERASVRLHLEQNVDGDFAGRRPQVLLVHGLTYSSHEFDLEYQDYSLVDFLVQNGFSVWLLDVAGYGRSGRVADGFRVNSDYAAADVGAAVSYIRGATGDDKVDLLGWSWGTVTTARMAAAHPEWIGKLILYAPGLRTVKGDPPASPWHENTWEHAVSDFQTLPNGEIDFTTVDPAVVHMFASNCWRHDGHGSPNGGRADLFGKGGEPLFDARRLAMPVLLLIGTKDFGYSREAFESAFQQLPRREESRLVIVEGGSHVLMFERDHYKPFQRAVLSFLRD